MMKTKIQDLKIVESFLFNSFEKVINIERVRKPFLLAAMEKENPITLREVVESEKLVK